jgi:molybdenum cofactor cytidylyltransferase
MPVAAILLAAGASRRLGEPKQLVRFGGETLLKRAVRLAEEAGASPVITVLGAHFFEICAAIPQHDSIRVFNDQWEQGIASSIHAGLGALAAMKSAMAGVLILPCDQPRLTAAHLKTLLGAFASRSAGAIVASRYAETLGIPAVFPRSVFPRLLKLRGDQGARALLAKPPCELIAEDFAGGAIDIDTPEDLAQLE